VVIYDRSLACVECGTNFIFTAEDQQYHADKGYSNEPKRCPGCRQNRRSQRDGGFGGGYAGSAPRQMFPSVCAGCGKNTEVPFQPRGDRSVYCSDCFSRQRSPATSGSSYR